VVAVDFSDGTREVHTYNPDSSMATVTTRDGITLAYAYDAANRVRSITPSGGSATTRLDAGDAYAWDALSRPTRLERGLPGGSGLDPDLAVAYPSYDLGSRAGAEVVGSREPLSFRWDVFGNPEEVRLPAGVGRSATGAFLGFSRGYDTLDRLASTSGLGSTAPSGTLLGADWAWGGLSRLYGMSTRGALGTGMRLGYHGGAGAPAPSAPDGASSQWKLGRMAWGSVEGSGATAAPAVVWGDFGFGWRGHQGLESDGAKLGRAVLGDGSGPSVLAGLGWAWDYDGGVRLNEARPGAGNLEGAKPSSTLAESFTFTYGAGDEPLTHQRRLTGETVRFTTGPFGRITARGGAPFAYDAAGRRLADDRFGYRWDWRGQLVEVTVKPTWPDADNDGAPDASPFASHRVSYSYDARGRLLRRLHEGEAAADGSRPFIEERRYVWEAYRLAAEAAYGPAETGENLRWRKTYVPGPMGLDDAPQVVVEVFAPGPLSGTARTYTYLTDELGTVMGLVAEDEGTDPQHPPVPVRYRYTPYGQAHAEIGPELLRALADAEAIEVATTAGTIAQAIADETTAAPGALVLTWSLPLAAESLADGLVLERLVAGTGWQAVPAADLAVGTAPAAELSGEATTQLRVMLVAGWAEATSYRLRLTPALQDRLGRSFGRSEILYWSVPTAAEDEPVPPPSYDQRFPTVYDSYQAATATAGGRFPGGQTRLFQGLWTDPVTGLAYARVRWLDTRNAAWLSEDPAGAVDSVNLYAFVAWQPTMGTDPMGLCFGGLRCRDLLGVLGGTFRGAAQDVADFFTGPFRDTGEAAEETAASARRTDRTLRSNMGNRDPVIDALLAEDYDGLELPSRLHQQELGELGESARAIGETAGYAGRTAGHALNAADRYLLGTGLYKVAVIGGRRVLVRKGLGEGLADGVPRGVIARGDAALEFVPSRYRAEVARSFRGEPVAETLAEDLVVFRRWGGRASETGSPWFSPQPYARPGNARRYLALPEANTAENLTAFKIPAGTTILRGKVGSRAGEVRFGSNAVGGGVQIYLPDPSAAVPIR
jgi:RHS repeat-associated protein